MKQIGVRFVVLFFIAVSYLSCAASAGVLKTLDQELTSLVSKTEPYLVTVKGKGGVRNLIATGIVYDAGGHVVTSAYACSAPDFEVTFRDGSSYAATKVGVDNVSGLGILKITGRTTIAPKWGDPGKLRQGAWITVVGNSYGVPSAVNFGSYDGITDDGMLQLSVNVSPGASGAAVLNIDGEVVGILVAREAGAEVMIPDSSLVYPQSASYTARFFDGVGSPGGKCYAVPAGMAADVASQIIDHGKVRRGFLGIGPRNLPVARLKQLGLDNGVMVAELEGGSPAQQAGIQKGDIILAVETNAIRNTAALSRLIRSHLPDDTLSITLARNGQKKTVKVVLAEAADQLLMGGTGILGNNTRLGIPDRLAFTDIEGLREKMSQLQGEVESLRKELDRLKAKVNK